MVFAALFLAIASLVFSALMYLERVGTRRKCGYSDFYELAETLNDVQRKRKSELARERTALRRAAEGDRPPDPVISAPGDNRALGGVVRKEAPELELTSRKRA